MIDFPGGIRRLLALAAAPARAVESLADAPGIAVVSADTTVAESPLVTDQVLERLAAPIELGAKVARSTTAVQERADADAAADQLAASRADGAFAPGAAPPRPKRAEASIPRHESGRTRFVR